MTAKTFALLFHFHLSDSPLIQYIAPRFIFHSCGFPTVIAPIVLFSNLASLYKLFSIDFKSQ